MPYAKNPAPFGYNKNGTAKAPYGLTKSGYPRKKPGKTYISGHGAYKIGRTYMRGRGGYWADTYNNVRNATKGWAPAAGGFLGSAAGSVIAPGIGTGVGGSIGSAAGNIYSKITGWGDYKVTSNSLLGADGSIVPVFGEDSIRVRKRECIAHINATQDFNNNVFPINPGLSEVFPWLSSIAQNYEQYKFNGLVFQFKSTSSDAIASTTNLGLGQVILATDYNADSSPFVNDLQMLGTMFSNSDKPSRDILHAIECAPSQQAQKLYYCRSGDVPSGADARLYDMGIFQLATLNMGANYEGMGQLFVSYDITFSKAVMNNQLGFSINTDKFVFTGVDNTHVFGTTQTADTYNNLGITFTSSNEIAFPVTLESGYYMITLYYQGAGTASTAMNAVPTNCSTVEDGVSTVSDANGIPNSILMVRWIFRINDRDASILISSATLPTGIYVANMIITQVNGEIYV